MSDIPMLTGPNGGELVFDTASGAVMEKLARGSFPTHPATDPAPFVPQPDRLAQMQTALDDIRDACGREGRTMTPSEVS